MTGHAADPPADPPGDRPADPLAEREEAARAEAAFLATYRADRYPRPAVAVDIVVLTLSRGRMEVLLIRRGEEPFLGQWALPGGFVRVREGADQGEDLDDAAARELREETGLLASAVHLDQLAAFGAPRRDPRLRVITIAYYALVRPELAAEVRAGTDAAHAAFVPVDEALRLELAFDHADILRAALAHVRAQIDREPIAFALVPATFTIAELRLVYEVLGGEGPLDPGNFARRFARLEARGLVEPAPGKRVTGARPAKVYRFRR